MNTSLEIVAPAAGEPTEQIHIDTSAIPPQMRDELAVATMDLLYGILSQPGGRERLEAKKRELAARH